MGRTVALKILPGELAENERFRARFLHESRVAGAVNHPNVIPVYDAGESDGLLYISMRYVEGTDLRGLLRTDGPLDVQRAVSIISQAASALGATHQRGLIHRDVKPANMLLVPRTSEDGTDHVYLSDFGLAKNLGSLSGLTKSGQFMGTVGYVAPEQIRGKGVDKRTDVYALGCVLFECLTGWQPFRRKDDFATIMAHVNDAPQVVSELRPGMPGGDRRRRGAGPGEGPRRPLRELRGAGRRAAPRGGRADGADAAAGDRARRAGAAVLEGIGLVRCRGRQGVGVARGAGGATGGRRDGGRLARRRSGRRRRHERRRAGRGRRDGLGGRDRATVGRTWHAGRPPPPPPPPGPVRRDASSPPRRLPGGARVGCSASWRWAASSRSPSSCSAGAETTTSRRRPRRLRSPPRRRTPGPRRATAPGARRRPRRRHASRSRPRSWAGRSRSSAGSSARTRRRRRRRSSPTTRRSTRGTRRRRCRARCITRRRSATAASSS